jgi:hypothetical protein
MKTRKSNKEEKESKCENPEPKSSNAPITKAELEVFEVEVMAFIESEVDQK